MPVMSLRAGVSCASETAAMSKRGRLKVSTRVWRPGGLEARLDQAGHGVRGLGARALVAEGRAGDVVEGDRRLGGVAGVPAAGPAAIAESAAAASRTRRSPKRIASV